MDDELQLTWIYWTVDDSLLSNGFYHGAALTVDGFYLCRFLLQVPAQDDLWYHRHVPWHGRHHRLSLGPIRRARLPVHPSRYVFPFVNHFKQC